MKVTVALPVESVEAIRRLVADGGAAVRPARHAGLAGRRGRGALLGQALADTGGAMTDQELQWADQVLGRSGSAGIAA